MKRLVIGVALSLGLVAGASAQNMWNTHTNRHGQTSGMDSRGNLINCHTYAFGNTRCY